MRGGLDLPLIGLPPFNPEVIPAERAFEEVQRSIEGKVYPTLEENVTAVKAFLTELEAKPDQVSSLTCWDWIEVAAQQLPTCYLA